MGRYAPSYSGERRTSALHVQLTPGERAELEAAAASAGVASLSAFARFLFFRRPFDAGPVAATRRNPDASRLAGELKAIGNNLNQLTHLAHRTGAVASEDDLRATIMSLEGRVRAGDRPMIPRCTVGKGITGAAQYVLSEGRDPETGKRRRRPANGNSRVAWIGGTGFGFDIENREDADLARRIMEFDALNQASRTRQCEKDCVHLSLGWRPGETPTREEMEAAAREALKAIGMENAKALFVAHNDEAYAAPPYRRLQNQSGDRPRLRSEGKFPEALALGRGL